MVSGASAALRARTLLSAVALWVGGLLARLLHNLDPCPPGSPSCTWASCMGDRLPCPSGMPKARTPTTNRSLHDFPNLTSLLHSSRAVAAGVLSQSLQPAGWEGRSVLWSKVWTCWTHEAGAGTPLQSTVTRLRGRGQQGCFVPWFTWLHIKAATWKHKIRGCLARTHEHSCISKSETVLVTWHINFTQAKARTTSGVKWLPFRSGFASLRCNTIH